MVIRLMTQPFAEHIAHCSCGDQEVSRYPSAGTGNDVEELRQRQDELSNDYWSWENLIAKANFLFDRPLKVGPIPESSRTSFSADTAADG